MSVTETFPAWYLGRNPEKRVIEASYSDDLARTFGDKCRRKVEVFGPELWGLEIDRRRADKSDWGIKDHNGGMVSAGIGGSLTGKGADCLPAGTMIATEVGDVDIANLVRMPNPPRVFSFEHATGEVVLKKIESRRERLADGLFEVETSGGNTVRSTGEHRYYCPEQGYKSASVLEPGDSLIVFAAREDLSTLRGREERGFDDLQSVLRQNQEMHDRSPLCFLWRAFREATLRIRKGNAKRTKTVFLFPKMYRIGSKGKVRSVREARSGKRSEILFERMQGIGKAIQAAVERLSRMWRPIQTSIAPDCLLFQGMRRRSPQETNAGSGELELQGRDELRETVQRDAQSHSGTGWMGMRDLWDAARWSSVAYKPQSAPCQRGQGGQPCGEHDNALQDVPCCASQVKIESVSSVGKVGNGPVKVYDLQIEGTHNFFANGILVHNCLIIDDPVKNRQEADSQTYRDRVWSEWQSTLSTRLHPKAAVVVVLTRWHEDDLAGRLIKAEPNRWKLLNLPAIAEEDDPLGRPIGAALWPERYDEAELAGIKITAGSRDWEALYQGRPSPLQGGLFKRQTFRRFKYHPEKRIVELFSDSGTKIYSLADCKVFQTCDVAGSLKSSADYFVLGTFALAPAGELLILDIFRDRLEGPDQPALLQRKFREWSPVVQGIESKSMGLTLYQSMIRSGLPILELTPGTKDKYTRALSMAPRYQAGMVYHRQGASWVDELETELASFPSGAHDDQVDVVVYAGDVMEWVLGNVPSGAGAYVID